MKNISQEVMNALVACLTESKDQAFLQASSVEEDFQLDQLDMTSLRMVEVCMHLEQSLGVDIDLEEFEETKSFHDLVALCEQLAGD